jgi:hypothetical protein
MQRQRKLTSLVEAIVNVSIGYVVAIAGQIVVFPVFGLDVSLAQNLKIGACFTVISIVRSYCVRRVFENWAIKQQ